MNLIKQISALILIATLAAAQGCATKAPVGNDPPWNEAVHEDAKEWTACSGGAAQPGQENDEQAGAAFFMQSKPRLSTVQIWLDSGKTVTDRIRAYLDACFDDSDDPPQATPQARFPASPLVGRWYGLDRTHDSAVVFVFSPSADFSWETRGRQITGTYALGPDKATLVLKQEGKEDTRIRCEFINDRSVIFAFGEKKLVLLNRVGGGLAPSVLSHHRTYGSVYGGS